MTQIKDNPRLAFRIARALPERGGWSWQWLPRLALGVLTVVTVAVALRTFYDSSTEVLRTESSNTPPAASGTIEQPRSNDHKTPAERVVILPRTSVEPSLNDRRTISEGDHDFSLPPISAAVALDVDALTPSELAVEPELVAPLVIADLPSSFDFSPR